LHGYGKEGALEVLVSDDSAIEIAVDLGGRCHHSGLIRRLVVAVADTRGEEVEQANVGDGGKVRHRERETDEK
jgi:hypothetical protein